MFNKKSTKYIAVDPTVAQALKQITATNKNMDAKYSKEFSDLRKLIAEKQGGSSEESSKSCSLMDKLEALEKQFQNDMTKLNKDVDLLSGQLEKWTTKVNAWQCSKTIMMNGLPIEGKRDF